MCKEAMRVFRGRSNVIGQSSCNMQQNLQLIEVLKVFKVLDSSRVTYDYY